MICLALRSRFVSTSPSVTRVNHRSNVDPGPPKADFRLEMINRFLPSGDQTGLKSAAGVVATGRNPVPSAFITKTSWLPSLGAAGGKRSGSRPETTPGRHRRPRRNW